jgi:hypothetical protein
MARISAERLLSLDRNLEQVQVILRYAQFSSAHHRLFDVRARLRGLYGCVSLSELEDTIRLGRIFSGKAKSGRHFSSLMRSLSRYNADFQREATTMVAAGSENVKLVGRFVHIKASCNECRNAIWTVIKDGHAEFCCDECNPQTITKVHERIDRSAISNGEHSYHGDPLSIEKWPTLNRMRELCSGALHEYLISYS